MNIGVVVLAAGESKRMGILKSILPIQGEPMVKKIVDEVLETNYHPVTVVLGSNKDKVAQTLKGVPVGIIDNPFWANGIGSSIRMGLVGSYMLTKGFDGLVYLSSDMPLIKADDIHYIVEQGIKTDKPIIKYKGVDFPVLVKSSKFEKILDLNDDQALNGLESENVLTLSLKSKQVDLNTPEDYLRFTESLN